MRTPRFDISWSGNEADEESGFETSFLNGQKVIDPLALQRSARDDLKAKLRRARRP
jgi:hypothetical protein